MESRSWRWFAVRVEGLFARPVAHDMAGNPVFSSRLQAHFFATPVEPSREGTRP